MIQPQNFISEKEAAQISGVSIATLKRFVEAGYLDTEIDSDGVRLYSKAQLDEIFSLSRSLDSLIKEQDEQDKQPTSSSNNGSVHSTASVQINLADRIEVEQTTNASAASFTKPDLNALQILENESAKLRNIISLQEQLLDSRDKELNDLREQRRWLRERIEKLEEKNDRDQLLILSETQTIRKLINVHAERKSTLTLALEWLGLKPANSGQELLPMRSQNAAGNG